MSPKATVLAAVLSACVLGIRANAQGQGPLPFDDQKGRHLNFEVGPVRSIVYDPQAERLVGLNQQGNRVVVLDPVTLDRLLEVPIGLGGASIAVRTGTDEVWVADSVSNCVSVVDVARGSLERTIRVPAEPHGIAFDEAGERAWVTCTGADVVVTIDVATYAVARQTAFPADAPRGIAFHAGRAWIASFLSGNGSAAIGSRSGPMRAHGVATTNAPGLQPLPDEDLFAIAPGATPAQDALDLAATRTALGTVLFDVVARPGHAELWIPNTQALNDLHRGEESFVGGQVVSNRITVVDVGGTGGVRVIDLDAIAPAGYRCAQPTSLCFDPVRSRAYVCAYGSDLLVVLDIAGDGTVSWAGSLLIPAKQSYPRGSGPRSCAIDPDGHTLWVFNRNDTSVARISLGALPPDVPFFVRAQDPVGIGFEATSTEESLGRHLFTDARNSGSRTSSCASCHVDGNTDNIVWDLSQYIDPEGTPPDQTQFGLDVKGPLLTQGTRRQEESGPYHWRGEKRHLNEFDNSFVGLLDRVDGQGQPETIGPDFQYLRHYVNRIAIRANPRQLRDRTHRPDELSGAHLFQNRLLPGGTTCASCHTLPLGTGGEVVASGVDGILRSLDVPALRGVADREQPAATVGGPFGTRPRSGAGLTHAGVYSRLEETFARTPASSFDTHAFGLPTREALQLAEFLRSFDTGLAPATAWQATAHAGNWAAVQADDLAFLKDQANVRNCDLVAFRTPPAGSTSAFVRTAQYDPAGSAFRLAGGRVPWITEAQLLAEAASGRPVTFLGVPVGMGLSIGLDRDCDGLYDADEIGAGTDPEFPDTDGDHFADGYEIAQGNDPLSAEPSVPNDTSPPILVGPVKLVYATTNTIKFQFHTSEYCRVHVGYDGGTPVQRIPLDHLGDTEHWVVLGDLEPGTSYVIDLEMRDPAGNIFTDSSTVLSTRPRALPQALRAAGIQVTVRGTATPMLVADVDLRLGDQPAPAGHIAVGSVFRLPLLGGPPELVASGVQAATEASGHAYVRASLANLQGAPGTLFFVLQDVAPPSSGAPPYVRAYSAEVFETTIY